MMGMRKKKTESEAMIRKPNKQHKKGVAVYSASWRKGLARAEDLD